MSLVTRWSVLLVLLSVPAAADPLSGTWIAEGHGDSEQLESSQR